MISKLSQDVVQETKEVKVSYCREALEEQIRNLTDELERLKNIASYFTNDKEN
jgi:hypothetical protein